MYDITIQIDIYISEMMADLNVHSSKKSTALQFVLKNLITYQYYIVDDVSTEL